ncbi:CS and HSP20-like domain protein [Rhodotorula toruloides]|uniref:NudC domain-containing protein 1 n=1 Tax=Rhodotorula toruloides TaxID=5286 RepID=A0A511KCQ1_RHOTO|nr:CS and HSP20-like domain protein [Rhodotorula toruloides]
MARIAPPGDTLSFPTTPSLLNPHFESYKLASPPQGDDAVTTFPLSRAFKTPALPDHARMSYNEVSDRARFNHLQPGKEGDVLFVDGEGVVTAVQVDKVTAQPIFHTLLRLPSPPSSSGLVPEYPAALPFAASLWVITDGQGSLHLVRIDRSKAQWTGEIQASFRLEQDATPFRLHAAEQLNDEEAILLLSVVIKEVGKPAPQAAPAPSTSVGSTARRLIPSTTSFHYLSTRIPLRPSEASSPQALPVDWRLKGHDLPSYVSFDAAAGRFIVGSTSRLVQIDAGDQKDAAGEAGEGEDVPMADEVESSGQVGGQAGGTAAPKPPLFSWIQDKDSVTVAFPIPSDTPTSSIRITFSRQFVSLHVASAAAALASSCPVSAAALPHVSHKKLWDDILPHQSVWTFDREAEGRNSSYGLLTLHLEKENAGTRWSDVFASTKVPTDDPSSAKIVEIDPQQEYEDIQETLDRSELAAITERMEQWAQGIMKGGLGHSEEGFGSGIPTSLMGDEIDVEVDAESGRPFVVTWIEEAAKAGTPRIVCPHPSVSYSLLSTAIPLASSAPVDPTVTIKHDVDGLLFAPPSALGTYRWSHQSTFPALAFVLATKRDTRFIYHYSTRVCLAFDAPALLPGPQTTRHGLSGGNVFAYFAPPLGRTRETKGTQMVVRVGGPGSGALMGVAAVELDGGETAVLALCERELVVLRILS